MKAYCNKAFDTFCILLHFCLTTWTFQQLLNQLNKAISLFGILCQLCHPLLMMMTAVPLLTAAMATAAMLEAGLIAMLAVRDKISEPGIMLFMLRPPVLQKQLVLLLLRQSAALLRLNGQELLRWQNNQELQLRTPVLIAYRRCSTSREMSNRKLTLSKVN